MLSGQWRSACSPCDHDGDRDPGAGAGEVDAGSYDAASVPGTGPGEARSHTDCCTRVRGRALPPRNVCAPVQSVTPSSPSGDSHRVAFCHYSRRLELRVRGTSVVLCDPQESFDGPHHRSYRHFPWCRRASGDMSALVRPPDRGGRLDCSSFPVANRRAVNI